MILAKSDAFDAFPQKTEISKKFRFKRKTSVYTEQKAQINKTLDIYIGKNHLPKLLSYGNHFRRILLKQATVAQPHIERNP